MSEDNPIRIFVTHTFSDHPDYSRVFEYLESATNFFYKNCSDPSELPAPGGKEAERNALSAQIKAAEIVLFPAGMYSADQDSLSYQMGVAKASGIPIVALEPFGGVEEIHADIATQVQGTVEWNDRLIVDMVRHHARGEETTRFETIEFEMP